MESLYYADIGFQMILVGGALGIIVILIGYVLFSVLNFLGKGG